MGKVSKLGLLSQQDIVITPGGPRKRKDVHLIESGHHLSGENGIFKKIHTQSGKVIKEFGRINESGVRNRKSLRKRKTNRLLAEVAGAQVPISDQWIVFSGWTNNSGIPISLFRTTWTVPPAPATEDGQLIYLFNGLEDAPNTVILQPVLQWGTSPAGGGNHWAVANWYVGGPGGGLAFHGPLVQVNEGDVLQGIMRLSGQSYNAFSYNSSFQGIGADLPIKNVSEIVWAVETLECYGLTQFSDYPNTLKTSMEQIEITLGNTDATIVWKPFNQVTDNGQHCSIISNTSPDGRVDLYYS